MPANRLAAKQPSVALKLKQTALGRRVCKMEILTRNAPELLQGKEGYFVYTGLFWGGGQGMMGKSRPEQVENNLKNNNK